MKTLMTYQDLHRRWQVPLGTLYSWVSRGELPAIRLGRRVVRFSPELINNLEERARRSTAAVEPFDGAQ